MANISTYLEDILLNLVMRNTAYPGGAPAAVYCGLMDDTAVEAEMEAGTLDDEIAGYTGNRKAITFGAPVDVGGKATIKNTVALEFESMPAPDTKKVKYAIVCDAATEGHILYWCPLTEPKSWNAGDTFRLPVDGLVLDLA